MLIDILGVLYITAQKKNQKMIFFYNLFICGAIVSQCFYSLEILRRMGDIMYWYWAFPLAYVLYNKKGNNNDIQE